jgi:hypothetical protein
VQWRSAAERAGVIRSSWERACGRSAGLEGTLRSRRIGWRQVERAYTEEMRALYRRDKSLFVDLVEQAADVLVTLVGELEGDEDKVWCARRLLYDMLLEVAWDRGVLIDPDLEGLEGQLLEIRRKEVLAAEGLPLECPVCRRPASTALAIRDSPGRGYCSEACLNQAHASWKAANERKQDESGRRP